MIYTDSDITTIPKSRVFPKKIRYENVLLAHPQYQAIPKWSLSNPEQDTIEMAKEYLSNHKMAFDPALFNLTVINGLTSIHKAVTSTPMHNFFPCIRSLQSLGWV